MNSAQRTPHVRDSSDLGPGRSIAWQGGRSQAARVRVYPRSRAVVVVELSGEIDACNAESVGQYMGNFISPPRPLVVDLTDVSFLGARGIRQLFALGDECVKAGVEWTLVVANNLLNRLLHITDRNNVLPVVGSLAEALRRGMACRIRSLTWKSRVKSVMCASILST